jgi:hypothetical protein
VVRAGAADHRAGLANVTARRAARSHTPAHRGARQLALLGFGDLAIARQLSPALST